MSAFADCGGCDAAHRSASGADEPNSLGFP
jgi:hypothetical protein